ncbi:MAG: hypothetical protein K1X83_08745 [Oligoflexia bacterium]|nr:hypothetical protein [Oligoflexia bacterium]
MPEPIDRSSLRPRLRPERQIEPGPSVPSALEALVQGGLESEADLEALDAINAIAIIDFMSGAWVGPRQPLQSRAIRERLEEALLARAEELSLWDLSDLTHRYRVARVEAGGFINELVDLTLRNTDPTAPCSTDEEEEDRLEAAIDLLRELGLAQIRNSRALDDCVKIITQSSFHLSREDAVEIMRGLGMMHASYPTFMTRLAVGLHNEIPDMDSRHATIMAMGMGEIRFKSERCWTALAGHVEANLTRYKPQELILMTWNAALAGRRSFDRIWEAVIRNTPRLELSWMRMLTRAGLYREMDLPEHLAVCLEPRFAQSEEFLQFRHINRELAEILPRLDLSFRTNVAANTYQLGVVVDFEDGPVELRPTAAWRDYIDFDSRKPLGGAEHLRDTLVERAGIEVVRVEIARLRDPDFEGYLADLLDL